MHKPWLRYKLCKNLQESTIWCWSCAFKLQRYSKRYSSARFFWEFWQLFQSATLLKTRLHHTWILVSFVKYFSWILPIFSACKFTIKEIPAQPFSCKFCKIFKKTYFADSLQTTASNLWLILDSFIVLLFIKMENKEISKIIAL